MHQGGLKRGGERRWALKCPLRAAGGWRGVLANKFGVPCSALSMMTPFCNSCNNSIFCASGFPTVVGADYRVARAILSCDMFLIMWI
jgi:hypothetical protein